MRKGMVRLGANSNAFYATRYCFVIQTKHLSSRPISGRWRLAGLDPLVELISHDRPTPRSPAVDACLIVLSVQCHTCWPLQCPAQLPGLPWVKCRQGH